MSYEFKEKENDRYRSSIEREFLSNPNPFPRNPVCSKDSLPKFCLGRNEEIGIIKNGIEKVATTYNHKSAWIPINGGGGTGKSTISLYVYDSAKHKKSTDLEIDYLECAYIECPSDPQFITVSALYKKILEDLGDTPGNFPYFLGFKFLVKLCQFFDKNSTIKSEFLRIFGPTWSKIQTVSKHMETIMLLKQIAPNFAEDLKKFVKDYDFFILGNKEINLQIDYIQTLIDLISTNTDNRLAAYNRMMGKNITSEDEANKMLENLIIVLNFLFEKTCLLVIIDNLENLPETQISIQQLFRLLLKFRDTINNCLLLMIGSTDFWARFSKNLNTSEINMLSGFKFDQISLVNLSEIEASRIMSRYLTEFWDSIKSEYRPKGADSLFPFSADAFKYLYEITDTNLRDSLKELNKIVEKFKTENTIEYIRGIKDAVFRLRPKTEKLYLFENERNYLEEFLSNYTDRNLLSRNIEYGLINAFNALKDQSHFNKDINKVDHEPSITLDDGGKAKPDVFLTLFGNESAQNIRKAEIQVKAYYPSNFVKFKEIEGSFTLLKEKKTHYLHFITFSPLENKIIEELQIFGSQVGRVSNLSDEETYYLLLLTKEFSNLFFKTEIPDVPTILQILEKINIPISEFLDKVKKVKIADVEPPVKPPTKVPVQKPLPVSTPKTPEEKISNPSKLEDQLINVLKIKKIIKTKQELVDEMKKYATSQNVINNAISTLQQKKRIQYSRKAPQGWSLL